MIDSGFQVEKKDFIQEHRLMELVIKFLSLIYYQKMMWLKLWRNYTNILLSNCINFEDKP